MKEVKPKLMDINLLKANETNPRIIKDDKFEKLCKSLREFPKMLEYRPVIVNSDMVVLAGNMRMKAAIEIGLEKIPVIVASELTDAEQRELIIKDNVGYGEWDWETLANEWETEQLEDWGLDVMKHDWKNLDFDEEPPHPNATKLENLITIVIPEDLLEDKSIIFEEVKSLLQEKYSGCEVK